MMTQVFFAELSTANTVTIGELMELVPPDRQRELAALASDPDRKLGLYAELLVRSQINESLGLGNDRIVFEKQEHGKPYLKGNPEFYFSLSHTKNAIAAAFSECEVGVDLERVKAIDCRVAKRAFSPKEQTHVLSHQNKDLAFYEVWTRKEAYLKWTGTGLSAPLNSFDTYDAENSDRIYTREAGAYVLSVCCESIVSKAPALILLTESDLYSHFKRLG